MGRVGMDCGSAGRRRVSGNRVGVDVGLSGACRGKNRSRGWSCCWGLNPGPLPYQGSALPLSYSSLVRGLFAAVTVAGKGRVGGPIQRFTAGTASTRSGAGDGNRTHVCSLEGCRSTIELRPRCRSARRTSWSGELRGAPTRRGGNLPPRAAPRGSPCSGHRVEDDGRRVWSRARGVRTGGERRIRTAEGCAIRFTV